ncbi:MAG TPA: 50S ribosomal protein L11 methyltransferase [Polyangiales bacterium]|jgi:ribosomal protein L11 methyltransferase|nr:50S ribosomal protein L11 methyltransferase [Polyangiales bacterium]
MSEPRYPYLHVAVGLDEVELVSSLLFDLGALGIEERDASTLLKSQAGDETTTLVASFEDDASANAAQAELGDKWRAQLEHVVGDAWRDGWKAYFKPLRVGERFVVRPSWEPYEAQPKDLVITLDPGQAFGTGTHETTQLLLGALSGHVQEGMRVLDVGTGSGILAIGACLLGASHVTAIDTDPLAVSATLENAEANGVSARIAASDTKVEAIAEAFPLVLANIEARVLVPLVDVLTARVALGGKLFLSGLLAQDMDRMHAAYAHMRVIKQLEAGDWRALLLERVSG